MITDITGIEHYAKGKIKFLDINMKSSYLTTYFINCINLGVYQ